MDENWGHLHLSSYKPVARASPPNLQVCFSPTPWREGNRRPACAGCGPLLGSAPGLWGQPAVRIHVSMGLWDSGLERWRIFIHIWLFKSGADIPQGFVILNSVCMWICMAMSRHVLAVVVGLFVGISRHITNWIRSIKEFETCHVHYLERLLLRPL